MQFSEVIVSIPGSKRAELAPRLVKLERTLVRQSQRDVEIVEAVIRILEHPAHKRLADKPRNLIKDTTNETN